MSITDPRFVAANKIERFRGGVLVQRLADSLEWEAWAPCSRPTGGDLPGISLGGEADQLLQGKWYRLLGTGARDGTKIGTWDIPVLNQVVKTPGTCGGRPRLDNTRMDVQTFVNLWRQGAADSEILDSYPDMTDADLWVVREWLKDPKNAAEVTTIDEDSVDGPYDWTLPESKYTPELKHERCTIWYDGPLSNIFRDSDGNGFILHWGTSLETAELYILFPVATLQIADWIAGKNEHEIGISAPFAVFVTIENHTGTVTISDKKTAQEIEDYLPRSGNV